MQDYILQIENSQIKGHTWRGIYTLHPDTINVHQARYEDLQGGEGGGGGGGGVQ